MGVTGKMFSPFACFDRRLRLLWTPIFFPHYNLTCSRTWKNNAIRSLYKLITKWQRFVSSYPSIPVGNFFFRRLIYKKNKQKFNFFSESYHCHFFSRVGRCVCARGWEKRPSHGEAAAGAGAHSITPLELFVRHLSVSTEGGEARRPGPREKSHRHGRNHRHHRRQHQRLAAPADGSKLRPASSNGLLKIGSKGQSLIPLESPFE